MSDVNITIPLPILVAGQYFKVRYRDEPSHAWTDLADQTNAPFTISGLAIGMYELSATLVRSEDPLVECEEVIQYFEVVAGSPCDSFSFAIVANDDATLYHLHITTAGAPIAVPCGGYDIVYGIVGGPMTTIHYANVSAITILPASNHVYHVEVRALDCEGNYTTCDNMDVNPPEGGCTHATLVSAKLLRNFAAFPPLGWYIELTIVQSAPPTNPFAVAYSQNNLFPPGSTGNDPGGMIALNATPATTVLTFPVQPNETVNPTLVNGRWIHVLYYNGTIADRCAWSTKWAASFEFT